MRSTRRIGSIAAGMIIGFLAPFASVPARAAATPPVYGIGVDAATPTPCASAAAGTLPPACHNFEYTDYFPNTGITVPSGALIDFGLSQGSPDAFHTTALLAQSPAFPASYQAAFFPQNENDFGGADAGDPTGQQDFPPAIWAPGCGTHAGTTADPCPYDGSATHNSGAMANFGGPQVHFVYQVTNTGESDMTVHYVCLIHFGMQGTLTVLPSGSGTTPTTAGDQSTGAPALAQYATRTADAMAAETAADTTGKTTNADGTTTWNVTAGLDGANSDPMVQVLEMLPSTVNIKSGDTVHWSTPTTFEIHTVTFPEGPLSHVNDAFPFVCEGGASADTPAAPPAFAPCGPGPNLEVHENVAPAGGIAITQPGTASAPTEATSGIIASIPGAGFPSSYNFNFPTKSSSAVSYAYQCTVHDHMTGVVLAAATVVPVLPAAGLQSRPSAPSRPPIIWVLLAIGAAIVLTVIGAVSRARTRTRDLTS